MMFTMSTALVAAFLATATAAAPAPAASTPLLAQDADEAACEGKKKGDKCTDGEDRPGTCQPDDDEPEVLECEDKDDDKD